MIIGFRILLNIEQSDYIGSLSPAAGVRILMHHQHDMPFPEDKGFHVGPGLASSVGIKQVRPQAHPKWYGPLMFLVDQ